MVSARNRTLVLVKRLGLVGGKGLEGMVVVCVCVNEQ